MPLFDIVSTKSSLVAVSLLGSSGHCCWPNFYLEAKQTDNESAGPQISLGLSCLICKRHSSDHAECFSPKKNFLNNAEMLTKLGADVP